jgi:protein SCO1/2
LNEDKNLVFLSYSVTPWIDNPALLKNYKEENKINNKKWHFLTGTKGNIYKLARQSYFAEEDIGFSKDSTEFLHTEHFILVDKTKRIRGIYNGTLTLEMQQLIEDIKTLERE